MCVIESVWALSGAPELQSGCQSEQPLEMEKRAAEGGKAAFRNGDVVDIISCIFCNCILLAESRDLISDLNPLKVQLSGSSVDLGSCAED